MFFVRKTYFERIKKIAGRRHIGNGQFPAVHPTIILFLRNGVKEIAKDRLKTWPYF